MNISFTGEEVFNSKAFEYKRTTSANEDIKYLNTATANLKEAGHSALKMECSNNGAPRIKTNGYDFFFPENGFVTYDRAMIKDNGSNIIRVFKKDDFASNSAYKKAFDEYLTTTKSIIGKFLKQM